MSMASGRWLSNKQHMGTANLHVDAYWDTAQIWFYMAHLQVGLLLFVQHSNSVLTHESQLVNETLAKLSASL